mgnify:CR=1 FL=1
MPNSHYTNSFCLIICYVDDFVITTVSDLRHWSITIFYQRIAFDPRLCL